MIPNLEVKPLPYSNLPGLSENQLKQHHDVLYAGYVKKVNEIQDKLKTVDMNEVNATYSMLRELKLEETFAVNGVKLHEAYFANLGGNGQADGPIADLINQDFGSYDRWQQEFKASGMCARGWVVLAYDLDWNTIHNYSLDAHNMGDIYNAVPLFVLDVYEHAYFIDYGTNRKDYVSAVLNNADWDYANSVIKKYNLMDLRKEMGKAA